MTYLSPKDTKIKFNSKRCTLLLLKMIIKNYFAFNFFFHSLTHPRHTFNNNLLNVSYFSHFTEWWYQLFPKSKNSSTRPRSSTLQRYSCQWSSSCARTTLNVCSSRPISARTFNGAPSSRVNEKKFKLSRGAICGVKNMETVLIASCPARSSAR